MCVNFVQCGMLVFGHLKFSNCDVGEFAAYVDNVTLILYVELAAKKKHTWTPCGKEMHKKIPPKNPGDIEHENTKTFASSVNTLHIFVTDEFPVLLSRVI